MDKILTLLNKSAFILFFFILSLSEAFSSIAADGTQTTNTTLDPAKAIDAASKAISLVEQVKNSNSLLDHISDLNFTTPLPVGVSKTIGGLEYIIAIDSLSYDTIGGKIGMYMAIEVPSTGKRLAFGARNVRFDENGIKMGTQLMLLSNETVGFGRSTELTIKGDRGFTFVNVDCDGFQGMSIDAELQFGNDLMLPEDDTGKVLQGQFVKAAFRAQMTSWGDLIADISLTPFQLTSLPRFGFNVTGATFDYSDLANPAGMVFPTSYNADERGNTWQGVAIREVSVRIPNEFKGKNKAPIKLSGRNLLIDDIGLSGSFSATNLLALEEGKIANWQFAIDSVQVDIQKNQLTSGSLAGKIVVPIIDKKNPLGYKAVIQPGGDYAFQIYLTSNLPVSMWAAKMNLFPNSSITVERKGGRLLPRANLNGTVTVSPSGDASASFADLSFQGLQIQTVAPVIKVDAFDLSSPKAEQAMAGFPVSLKNIHVNKTGNQIGLSFDLIVNLVGEGANGFKADAGLIVWGEMSQASEIVSWQFKGVDLTSIKIDIDQGAFKMKGEMINYKAHPTFGKGFKGMIDAEFVPGLKVFAVAQFGSVNAFRYWFVDANLIIPTGIPIGPAVGLYGFGGGAYYHMKKEIGNPFKLSMDGKDAPADTTRNAGKTLSGVTYTPDAATGLGIRATVFIGLMPSEPFNGSATFEISFGANGGVRSIGFEGKGSFMSKIGTSSDKAMVSADINIAYDFDNTSLHGLMNAYINVVEIVKGTGPNNLAGQVVIHFDPDEWYIYIGHPDVNKRIGLKIAGLFTINAYLVIGTNIPEMPPPPEEVMKILRLDNTHDVGLIGKGGGFGFGASASFGADLSFLIFYAKLEAGIGFDVLLKNYGMDARCKGSSSPVGINGWYAKGQAYAYLHAELGIKVDMFFVKGQFTILDCSAALLLQATLPNPSWMFGKVAADYDILGGLVSGHVDFEVELGSKCAIMGVNPLAGIQVISKCSPANQEQKVDVFNAPQATFNMPMNKSFELKDENDRMKSFRVMLNDFKLSVNGRNINGALEWNNRNDVVAFNAIDVLPGEQTITLKVSVRFEELVNGNWQTVMNKGVAAGETFTSTFNTGPEPDYIMPSNIAYTYPQERQFNFYKNEYPSGYIQLIRGQRKPFVPEPGFKVEGRFIALDGSKEAFNYVYDSTTRKVSFNIPENLKLNTVYDLKLLKVPIEASGAIDKNVSAKVETQASGTNTTNVKTQTVEGTLDILQDKNIYENNLRTSKYANFFNKMDALSVSPGWNWSLETGVDIIGVNIIGDELFDAYEMGETNDERLVVLEALDDNVWLNTNFVPLVYPKYPMLTGMELDWLGRVPVEQLGVPPLKSIFINQSTKNKLLEDAELAAGAANISSGLSSIIYNLVPTGFKDYTNLQNKAAVNSLRYQDANLIRLMTTPYSNILKGSYGFRIKYTLPGIKYVTSFKNMAIKW